MNPTQEQHKAVTLFSTGASLAVEAGAGTGKTSTLKLMAESTPRRGQYLAFNKAIVEEAKLKFPRTVSCNTAHSLAYRAVGHKYRHRLNGGRIKSTEAARMLGLNAFVIDYGKEQKRLAPGWLSGLVNRTIAAFCNSADPEPTAMHVPYTDGIDLPGDDGRRTYGNNNAVAQHIMPAVRKAWADLTSETGQLRFSADHYLKMWQLGEPRIDADYVLFDEAQDASPVMLDIVKRQRAQVVYVGDTQQQIYEWRGAVNALATVDAANRTYLTESFRFGQPIADVANLLLSELDAELRLTGSGGPSVVGAAYVADTVSKATLCRTNAGAFGELFKAMKDGRRPHIVGGGSEVASFARAALELKSGQRTIHPELACFETWGEVQDYVEQDPEGGDLKLMVGLVDDLGAEQIIETIEKMVPESKADLIISTAHKAKGREWDSVKLHDDFPTGPTAVKPEQREVGPSDWRLLYVAVTRARFHLDIEACVAVRSLMAPKAPRPDPLPPVYVAEAPARAADPTSTPLFTTEAPASVEVVQVAPAGSFPKASPGDTIKGAFYRSQATGNVRGHYGEVEHTAVVIRRYGVKDRPELGLPHVWARPICGAKAGRLVTVEEAARFNHTSAAAVTPCERCALSRKANAGA